MLKVRILKSLSYFLLIMVLVLATSCSRSSATCANPIDPPENALEMAKQKASASPAFLINATLPDEWWLLFEDEQLDQFMQMVFTKNPTLQEARTNILLAKYTAQKVRSFLYPSLNLGGDVSRQKLSQTGLAATAGSGGEAHDITSMPVPPALTPPLPPGGTGGLPVYFTQYETELGLTYDFDIWGKNRKTLQAAIGEVYAKKADEAFTRLQLGISLAQVYFQLQIDYKRLSIAQAFLKNQNRYLELTQQLTEANIDPVQRVHTSQTYVASASQAILQIQADIAVNEYQLQAYLASSFEEEIHPIQVENKRLPKVPLPTSLPLHLIAHRPDIAAQLWLIESAGLQIQVAKAGFYPDVNLTALFGFQSLRLHDLLQWRSSFFNVNPAFTLPIFDGGRLTANLRYNEVSYDQAIYHYNNLVFNAVKEALSGIALLQNAEQQLQQYKSRLRAQEELFELTQIRLANHLDSDLDYLISEQNVLGARDQELIALGNTIQSILVLIKALGGGYEACQTEG
jgi:NodT family efflux transporter outer membrane factor (OMF) lipoprotein